MGEAIDPMWAEWYDCYFGTYDEDVEFFLGEARKSGGRILEVGCGTGRITIPLLQAGCDVVGFDPLPAMVERLKKRAGALGLVPSVCCQTMEAFAFNERFDLIIAPFRVFNHCLHRADQRAALENFRRHLAPGGRLILATFVPDPEMIAAASNVVQYMATVRNPETGRAVVCSNFNAEIDFLNQTRTDVWVFEELDSDQRIVRKVYLPLTIRWVYPGEMALLLELAGFSEFQVFGGFDYGPLDEGCREQVWIARPPAEQGPFSPRGRQGNDSL